MKKRLFNIGFLLFCWGIFLVVSFQTKITGGVISKNLGATGTLFGVVLFIVGIMLMIVSNGSDARVIRTSRFEREIKKHKDNIRGIERALNKVGTGVGGEHKLRSNLYAADVTGGGGGGRIILKKEKDIYYAVGYSHRHYKDIDFDTYEKES